MLTLRLYLVIAVILLVVKVIQLAIGHWVPFMTTRGGHGTSPLPPPPSLL